MSWSEKKHGRVKIVPSELILRTISPRPSDVQIIINNNIFVLQLLWRKQTIKLSQQAWTILTMRLSVLRMCHPTKLWTKLNQLLVSKALEDTYNVSWAIISRMQANCLNYIVFVWRHIWRYVFVSTSWLTEVRNSCQRVKFAIIWE